MKNSELRNLTIDELKDQLMKERKNYQKLKFSHSIASIENPVKLLYARRLIARINTLIREKELSNLKL